MKLSRPAIAGAIALGAALGAFALSEARAFAPLFGQAELSTLDWRIRNAAGTAGAQRWDSSSVVLVLFDSMSAETSPVLTPFPRDLLASLIDGVAAAGARTIGLDVYLARLYPELDFLGNGDARLRDAIERAGNVILVGPTSGSDTARVFSPVHPYFAEVAAGVATADLPTPYETVRDAALTVRTADGRLVPGFSVALYAHANGLDIDSLMAASLENGTLDIGALPDRFAQLPDHAVTQSMPIVFMGPPSRPGRQDGAFAGYSAGALQAISAFGLPEAWFRDKVVLLGSGFHAEERFRTSFYEERDSTGQIFGWMYGVEIRAHALENLLTGTHPVPLPWYARLGLLFALCLVATSLTFRRGVPTGGVATALLIAGNTLLAWVVFANGQVHVPIVGPTLGLVFAFLGSTSYVSIVEGKDKRRIKSAFKKYLSPAIVDQLASDPARLKLGGEKRRISIIFTDLAGFTSLSETLDPETLLSLLNDYLDEMSDIVLEEGGTLDKYIGDAIMAFYGAPLDQPDHAVRACRTAVRMQRRLEELNREWEGTGRPELRMRVGINTGNPVVGNIGGEQKFDYTALGDAVNLAARLEPACKTYGVGTMISARTREAAGDAIIVRELELLAVYGKAEPVPVYELVAMAGDDIGAARAELLGHYDAGLRAYRGRDFELALQYFRAALETDPKDRPSALYAERCSEYSRTPPPANWDFVERRQVK